MWRYAGINDAGEWMVYDKDGDIIQMALADETDRAIVGNGLPKFNLSTTHNFRYRNFDLSLFFRGAFGFDIFNVHDYYYGTRKFTGNVLKKAFGKNFAISPTASHAVTDYFLERGDYFKLDQLTLGYTFKTHNYRFIDGVRIYGRVYNHEVLGRRSVDIQCQRPYTGCIKYTHLLSEHPTIYSRSASRFLIITIKRP